MADDNIKYTKRRPTRGFTLVELLVVISIISLLTVVLLPTLGRASRSAKQVACGTNLRSIGIGWGMYRDDHPNSLPNAASLPIDPGDVSIVDVMSEFVSDGKTWKCPSDDCQCFQKYRTSYEYYIGGLLEADPTIESFLLGMLEQESSTYPIIADAEAFHPSSEDPQRRQSVYYDGHVDWFIGSEE